MGACARAFDGKKIDKDRCKAVDLLAEKSRSGLTQTPSTIKKSVNTMLRPCSFLAGFLCMMFAWGHAAEPQPRVGFRDALARKDGGYALAKPLWVPVTDDGWGEFAYPNGAHESIEGVGGIDITNSRKEVRISYWEGDTGSRGSYLKVPACPQTALLRKLTTQDECIEALGVPYLDFAPHQPIMCWGFFSMQLGVLEIVWIQYAFSDKGAVLGLAVARGSCKVEHVEVLPKDTPVMEKNSSSKLRTDKPSSAPGPEPANKK